METMERRFRAEGGGSEGSPDVCIHHADDILGGPSIMGTTLIRNFDYTKICSPEYRSIGNGSDEPLRGFPFINKLIYRCKNVRWYLFDAMNMQSARR